MDGVNERGLAPMLVLDLDVVVVVFKLDDLYLILVSFPPPHSLVVKNLDDLRNVIIRDDLYLLGSQNLALVLNAKRLLCLKRTCVGLLFMVCVRLP